MTPADVQMIRDALDACEQHQILLQEGEQQQPAVALVAEQMQAKAEKEKKARQGAREARGETVGKSLLKASSDLVEATKKAMDMFSSLHHQVMSRIELSSDDSSDYSSSSSSALSTESSD